MVKTITTHALALYAMAALAVLGVRSAPAQEVAGETREVKKTVPLPPEGVVYVEAFKGTIDVKTWDRAEVDILAQIEAAGLSSEEREAVALVEVRINARANAVDIRSDYDRVNDLRSFWNDDWNGGIELPFVHYTITMPRTARLDVKDFKSEINVASLRSAVHIESYKGPITVADLKGNLRIDTHKGRVRVTGLDGALDLNTHKSEVEVEFTRLSNRSRIDSYKGNVEITLPKEAGFELDADLGKKGDLDSDFSVSYQTARFGRHDRDQEYRGAVNGGGPLLSLRTHKGYYRMRQR
jgi:hypothetical protein